MNLIQPLLSRVIGFAGEKPTLTAILMQRRENNLLLTAVVRHCSKII